MILLILIQSIANENQESNDNKHVNIDTEL